jgi:tetratricopeptide (TPR) repeat protein
MHDKEIKYFTEGLLLAQKDFFIDAIVNFKLVIDKFPNSDLADDALYNIGICYLQLNQFEKAIETFQSQVTNYPEGTITVLGGEKEFGKTAAKAYYGMIICYLAMGKIIEAENLLFELKKFNSSTYILDNDERKTFEEIAIKTINEFKSINKINN